VRTLWVLALGLVALTTTPGCKRKEPEPIPGPKADSALGIYVRTPGIAWFQGSFDEAFARATFPRHCRGDHSLTAPRVTDLARNRKRLNPPAPTGICTDEPCPPIARPRHRLV
jgi:hypothetical protein